MAKTTKTETTPETKTQAPKKLTRRDAANKVVIEMKGKTTLSDLAEKANAYFVEAGGKDNVKEATMDVRKALQSAEAFGIVRLTLPTDILVEKV